MAPDACLLRSPGSRHERPALARPRVTTGNRLEHPARFLPADARRDFVKGGGGDCRRCNAALLSLSEKLSFRLLQEEFDYHERLVSLKDALYQTGIAHTSPGLDGTGILFQPLIQCQLPANIKPIVVRYPADRHLTYEQLLPLVIDALPGADPFILLGESFSGPLAVMAAAERPKNLIGLILCASFVAGPIPFIGPAVRLFARSLLFRFFPPLQRLKGRLEGYSTTELRGLSAAALALVRPQVMAARVRMVFRTDATDRATPM